MNGGNAVYSLRETVIEVESSLSSVIQIRDGWIRTVAEIRIRVEAVHGHARIIDSITAADHVLISETIGKSEPRTWGISLEFFERLGLAVRTGRRSQRPHV